MPAPRFWAMSTACALAFGAAAVNRHGGPTPIGAGSRAEVVDPSSFDRLQQGHTRVPFHIQEAIDVAVILNALRALRG
jgi:hypothetical protein